MSLGNTELRWKYEVKEIAALVPGARTGHLASVVRDTRISELWTLAPPRGLRGRATPQIARRER